MSYLHTSSRGDLVKKQVRTRCPPPRIPTPLPPLGRGNIGIIVSGSTMVRYDALEAYGNPITVDDHDGRIGKFREIIRRGKGPWPVDSRTIVSSGKTGE